MVMSADPVRISYATLINEPDTLRPAIEKAFSSAPGSLGIIVIDDLPAEFPQLREKLFLLGHRFATLPADVRETLAKPETTYSFGWSHGKEVMNGRPDTAKGSFYANPLLDHPEVADAQRAEHPEYYAGNVWPKGIEGLDEFESAFKALGRLVADVGIALAHACDRFDYAGRIAHLIEKSQSNKARLLHYYPADGEAESVAIDDACGTHLDHSLLTGLCSAQYFAPGPKPIAPPQDGAGLYIYARGTKEPVKVAIPPTSLAFQMGEALQLLTGDRLVATPHFVAAGKGRDGVSRETFAFFLQPDVDDVIGADGETFGQFTKRVLARHYTDLTPA